MTDMRDIDALLRVVADWQGSDLHLKGGSPPLIRVDGVLHRVEQEPPLDGHDTEEIALGIMPPDRRNVFRQRGSVSLVLRMVRVGSPTFDDLGLPAVVQRLAEEPRGLVLVTGPTGTGKTTTIGSMVDHINQGRACHIVTIEDPIEV